MDQQPHTENNRNKMMRKQITNCWLFHLFCLLIYFGAKKKSFICSVSISLITANYTKSLNIQMGLGKVILEKKNVFTK